jgi:hypothetical protein
MALRWRSGTSSAVESWTTISRLGPGAARFEKADMALRDARLQGQGELAGAAAPRQVRSMGPNMSGCGGRAAEAAAGDVRIMRRKIAPEPPVRRLPGA